jgi:hypothetical protein
LSLPVIGVAALDVLTMPSEPSGRCTSQVQPEPKLATADLPNSSLNLSNEPKALAIASASLPDGAPPPFGLRQFQ